MWVEETLQTGTAAEAGLREAGLARARAVLERGLAAGAFAGAVGVVARRGVVAAEWAVGEAQREPESARRPMKADTVFDLASVTKVVAGVTAALLLLDRGLWSLDETVDSLLPEFGRRGKEAVTVRHLLTHTSGLPAWLPLYCDSDNPDDTLRAICERDLLWEPGTRVEYSDLGFMLLGLLAEHVAGEPLDALLAREVVGPLALRSTGFWGKRGAANAPAAGFAATERGNRYETAMVARLGRSFGGWREHLIVGEVHDGNCHYAMGGVSAHAGLFSTARELAVFGQMLLGGGRYGGRRILSGAAVRAATSLQTPGLNAARGLGWILPREGVVQPWHWQPAPVGPRPHGEARALRPSPPAFGDLLSPRAYFHTGFTGTSIAVDPDADLVVALLTNRVHPDADTTHYRWVFPRFHNAVAASLDDD